MPSLTQTGEAGDNKAVGFGAERWHAQLQLVGEAEDNSALVTARSFANDNLIT